MQEKTKKIFNELQKLISDENDQRVYNHVVGVTKFIRKRAENNKLNENIIGLAEEAASVHDIGKYHGVIDSIFDERPKGVFHGLIGGYFIKNYQTPLTNLLENKESVCKIIACHTPFYINEDEILDFMKEPLPYLNIKHQKDCFIDGKKLSISPLTQEEKTATEVLIATDSSIVEDKYVGVEKRIEYIFERYGSEFSERKRKILSERLREIVRKFPIAEEK